MDEPSQHLGSWARSCEHWHTDISYLNICGAFYPGCSAEADTLEESRVRKVFSKTLRAAGLPRQFSPHCLQHTSPCSSSNKCELRQLGTPAELRGSLDVRRREVHTEDLGAVERALSDLAGSDKNIVDVQRFGDRLDLARRPDDARALVERATRAAGLSVTNITCASASSTKAGPPRAENSWRPRRRAEASTWAATTRRRSSSARRSARRRWTQAW